MSEQTAQPTGTAPFGPDGSAADGHPASGHDHHRLRRLVSAARDEADAYAGESDHPVGSYLVTLSAYGAGVAALTGAVALRDRGLPERLPWSDLALMTAATHKLSRLLAKDAVTSPLRAPFTTFHGAAGDAELKEEVRGTGLRKAVGELVTCPFCMAQWTATGFAFGLVMAPRPTRLVASVFTAVAGSDFLQLAYASAQKAARG